MDGSLVVDGSLVMPGNLVLGDSLVVGWGLVVDSLAGEDEEAIVDQVVTVSMSGLVQIHQPSRSPGGGARAEGPGIGGTGPGGHGRGQGPEATGQGPGPGLYVRMYALVLVVLSKYDRV